MRAYCDNPFCQNQSVKEVPVSVKAPADQVRVLCTACEESYSWGVQHGNMTCEGLKIDPPPQESDGDPLYRVVYVIDVNASDANEAARLTHQIMTDPHSLPPVLQMMDCKGKVVKIDLSKEK